MSGDTPELCYPLSGVGIRSKRPMVFLELTIGHSPKGKAAKRLINVPAIIDTGTDYTSFPRKVAEALGHVYDHGRPLNMHVVGGRIKIKRHTMRIRLYGPSSLPLKDEDIIPRYFRISAAIFDGPGQYGLIGCQDFLKMWEFRLSMRARQFSLIPTDPKLQEIVRAWQKKARKRRKQ